MKLISKISKIAPILLLVLVLSACSNDDDNNGGSDLPPSDPNIVEIAIATPELSSLVAAVIQADLTGILTGPGPFTVLAPTNTAFDNFLAANNFDALSDVPNDILTQVLLNHVISGEVTSSTLVTAGDGYTTTNADAPDSSNLSLYFNTSNGVVFNGISTVTDGGADIDASNGVIHIVDAVIGLPTIADFALANPALSNLVAALQSADSQNPSPGLIPLFMDQTSGPFTVFGPTDGAFANLLLELDDTGNTALGDLDPALVEAVLRTHVLADNVRSTELTTTTVEAINMEELDIDATALTITDPRDRVSNIVAALIDIQGINGVVHVIDTVLLPAE